MTYYESPLQLHPEASIYPNGHIAILFTDNDALLRVVTLQATEETNSLQLRSSLVVSESMTHYDLSFIAENCVAIAYSFLDATNVTSTIQTALVYDRGDHLELVDSTTIDEVSPLSFIHLESWTAFDPSDLQMVLVYAPASSQEDLVVQNVALSAQKNRIVLGARLNGRNGQMRVDSTGMHSLDIVMLQNRTFLVRFEACSRAVDLLLQYPQ